MIDILVPFKRPGILFSLVGLMQQQVDFNVIVRDDGWQSPFDDFNEIIITAISKRVNVKIIRNMSENKNVLFARKELFEESKEALIVYLDSDIVLQYDALSNLMQHVYSDSKKTFYQGVKLEVNANRKYYNDINIFGSQFNGMKEQQIRQLSNVETYFGDTAIVCYWRQHLMDVWKQIEVADVGLGGTDALMSAVACQNNKSISGTACSNVIGYHYYKNDFNRNWEIGADRYCFDKLKSIGIDKKIYTNIYPHIKD